MSTETTVQPITAQWVPVPKGRFPTKGRQPAVESNIPASLCVRQTPELFGGISTD